MNLTGNTVVVTGGGSGIGKALAEVFKDLGNEIIVAGQASNRDRDAAATPGMAHLVLDQDDASSIAAFAEKVRADHPVTNVLINNAGIQRVEDLKKDDATQADETFMTNLLGQVRVTAALMPVLLSQPHATIINITSALAFVPLATTPSYAASKAAFHPYTVSLRYQLRGHGHPRDRGGSADGADRAAGRTGAPLRRHAAPRPDRRDHGQAEGEAGHRGGRHRPRQAAAVRRAGRQVRRDLQKLQRRQRAALNPEAVMPNDTDLMLTLVDPAQAGDEVSQAFKLLPDINIFRAAANAETLFPPFMSYLARLFQPLELGKALERMIVLRVARRSNSAYAWRQNAVVARSVGVSDAQNRRA